MRIIDIPVNLRVGAAALIPVLALVVASSFIIRDSYNEYEKMSTLAEATHTISATSNLVHTLQVERGTTAGFLGSKGASMGAEMEKARLATDSQVDNYLSVLSAKKSRTIAPVELPVADLKTLRERISRLEAAGGDSFSFYTGQIADLLKYNDRLMLSGQEDDLTATLFSLTNLLDAKELAGQERGLGAGVIGAGKFDAARFDRFIAMGGAQGALLRRFYELSPEDRKEAFAGRIRSSGDAELTTLRLAMLGKGLETDLTTVSGAEWFATASRRINTMKELQDEILTQIAAVAGAKADAAWSKFISTLGFSLLALVASAGIALSLAYTVTRPLILLANCMTKLAAGDTETQLIHSEGRDEIGQMGQAVKNFIDSTKDRLEEQRRMDAEAAATKERERLANDHERQQRADEIDQAVEALGSALKRLSQGDLDCGIRKEFSGRLDTLRQDFNASVTALADALGSVRDIGAGIHTGVGELRSAADDLAHRTEHQAASLERTVTALDEISETVRQTAQRAGRAGDLVTETANHAGASRNVIDATIDAIGKVRDSSDQIGSIISVIDDIAFQTNLLALNAGVEAARAGEAGKGFAVVAQEVRELAQRSANAAREISGLIDRSGKEVASGVDLVGKTGETLHGIIERVDSIRAEVMAIVTATQEQAHALAEINASVADMDRSTQQNAAMVEQTTAATHTLAGEAGQLAARIAGFSFQGRQSHTPLRKAG